MTKSLNNMHFRLMMRCIGWIFVLMAFMITFPPKYVSGVNAIEGRINPNEGMVLVSILLVGIIIYCNNKLTNQINSWLFILFGYILSLILTTVNAFTSIESSVFIQGTKYLTDGKINIMLSLIYFIGFGIVFSNVLKILYNYLRIYFNIQDIKISTLKIFLFIIVVWCLQIVWFMPGTISFDAFRQFSEFFKLHVAELNFTYPKTNHHPWFVTLIFGYIFSAGKKIGGTNFGVFSIVFIQVIVTALIYSKVVKYAFSFAGKIVGIVTLVLFSSPIFALYSQTIDKSSLFFAFCAWYSLSYVKIFVSLPQKNKLDILSIINLFCSAFFMMMFRNDGGYVVLVSLLVLLVYTAFRFRKKVVAVSAVFLMIFCSYVSWQKIILPASNVIPGSSGEALTIPMRQVAYLYITHKSYFDKQDVYALNNIMAVKKIKRNYSVNVGDNLKSLYPVDTFLRKNSEIRDVKSGRLLLRSNSTVREHTSMFIKLWLKLGIKHPVQYLSLYIQANSGYLNPFLVSRSKTDSLFTSFNYVNSSKLIQPKWYHQYHYIFSFKYRNTVTNFVAAVLSFPPLLILINTGVPVWVALILVLLVLVKRRYSNLVAIFPLLLLAAVPTLSSVNGYSRYAIMGLAVLPVYVTFILNDFKKKNGEHIIE